MLTKMRKNNEKGFTLIELMIVIAIIGILAAIAIPQFSAYRARSFNASANADLRNTMTALEGYFVDYDVYTTNAAVLTSYGMFTSSGVNLRIAAISTNAYELRSFNAKAEDKAVTYTVGGPGASIEKLMP